MQEDEDDTLNSKSTLSPVWLVLNLAILLGMILWLVSDPSFEPLLGLAAALAGLGYIVKARRDMVIVVVLSLGFGMGLMFLFVKGNVPEVVVATNEVTKEIEVTRQVPVTTEVTRITTMEVTVVQSPTPTQIMATATPTIKEFLVGNWVCVGSEDGIGCVRNFTDLTDDEKLSFRCFSDTESVEVEVHSVRFTETGNWETKLSVFCHLPSGEKDGGISINTGIEYETSGDSILFEGPGGSFFLSFRIENERLLIDMLSDGVFFVFERRATGDIN